MFHFALHSHNLEKDVPPSVLSSGGTLSPNPVRCTRLPPRAFNGPSGGIEPGCAMRTGWSARSPIRAFVPRYPDHSMKAKGAFSAPLRNPSTRAWRYASPSGLNHAAKVGCWLPLVQSPQPTVRRLGAVSVPTLNPGQRKSLAAESINEIQYCLTNKKVTLLFLYDKRVLQA